MEVLGWERELGWTLGWEVELVCTSFSLVITVVEGLMLSTPLSILVASEDTLEDGEGSSDNTGLGVTMRLVVGSSAIRNVVVTSVTLGMIVVESGVNIDVVSVASTTGDELDTTKVEESALEDWEVLDTTVGTTVEEGTGDISTSDVVGAGEPVD